MSTTLETILARMEQLASGIFRGPHGGVLLVEHQGTWTLPATERTPGACSIRPEFALTCTALDPAAAAAIKRFIADGATHQSGDNVSTEIQRLEAQLSAAKQRAQMKYKPGELVPVIVMDAANRPVTHYEGDPNACWDQFNPALRFVKRINIPGNVR